jgi:hypothetical protein
LPLEIEGVQKFFRVLWLLCWVRLGAIFGVLGKLEDSIGYAKILKHGVVGKGMVDYDKVFEILQSVDFKGWISIEDGMNGLEEIRDSASFLRRKIREYGG